MSWLKDRTVKYIKHQLPVEIDGDIQVGENSYDLVKINVGEVFQVIPPWGGERGLYFIEGKYSDKVYHAWCYPQEYDDIITERHYVPRFFVGEGILLELKDRL